MSKRLTTEEFIARAKEVHGDKYDYSKAIYVNNRTKICIVCPKHGEFYQSPTSHLKGFGCSKCGYENLSRSKSKKTEQFIKEAVLVHGNYYDYSKTEYKSNYTKICIICPVHGEFWQTPSNHLKGHGCGKCKGSIISKKKTKYTVGMVLFNPTFGFYTIKNRLGDDRILVKFIRTGTEKECSLSSLSVNNVKDPLCPIVCGVGFIGYEASNLENISEKTSYIKWNAMIERCYGNSNPNPYKNCIVSKEWHNYSNFKKWYDENYIEGWEIDKDLFSQPNKKIYSAQTCCFLPLELNVFLASLTSRNEYKIGVTFDKNREKFKAQISLDGKNKFLGRYSTEEEAYNTYKKEKKKELKRVADKYKDCLDEKIYNAIINKDF